MSFNRPAIHGNSDTPHGPETIQARPATAIFSRLSPTNGRAVAPARWGTPRFGQSAPCDPARAALLTKLHARNHRLVTEGAPFDARHAPACCSGGCATPTAA
ncbi:hypothetical protein GCM10011504_04940 [Siccirubricoccus deserti]|nr:hypothetical protein GCM10011504_04940 [Siccirubricoccus deserti]